MNVEPGFPRAFGKYVLLRPFARGGMGELFIASSGELGGAEKLCLVKKVPDDHDSPGLSGRLLDEAKVAVRLNHSNLVQVFDAGKVDDELYIAMEFIEGRDLRGVWNQTAEKRGRFPLEIALYLIREVARALEYAHGYGGLNLVHRDIAPPNVLLSWHGSVKLTDFGLARSVLKNEKTAPGIVYGRVAYLAPEQARGEQADTRTDIFAAGVMLWELIAGRPLAEPIDDPVRSIERARHPRIVPPSRYVPGLSADVDAVVLRALAANRDQRYQNAGDFRQAISDQLAKIGPKTDSSQMAAFLRDLFGGEIEKEVKEHERLLREDLAKWRTQKEADKAARSEAKAKGPLAVDDRLWTNEKESPRAARSDSPKIKVPEKRNSPPAAKRDHLGDEEQTKLMDRKKDPSSPERAVAAAALARAPAVVEVNHEEAVSEIPGESLVGETLDARYKVLRLIGTGGMGAVYEAEHTEIGKKVAVKVLHAQYSQQADLVARFRREARAATKIGHPHIVDVTDFGTTKSKNVYYVMERLEGIDLADLLHHERKIAPDRAAHISIQICRALGAAHHAGIIHRDLKPENIFLISRDGDADFVKVLDFGIAKHDFGNTSANQPRRLTGPGIAMGTPEYMAPEQAAGKAIDGRVDIYAVGAMLYEMLTGEPPHASTNVMEIFSRKANEAATPVRKINPKVSVQLEAVVARALERDPNRRPKNMAAFEYELNKSLKGRRSAVASALGLRGDPEFLAADSDSPPSESDFLAQPTQPKNTSWQSAGVSEGWGQKLRDWYEPHKRMWNIAAACVLAAVVVLSWRSWRKKSAPTVQPVATPSKTTAQPETRFLLEWAQRALDSGRFVSPPGDNVKELLERIESVAPGTVGAAEIRDKAATILRRRTESDLKSSDWSDAVHDLESLMALRPDDDKIRAQYARVLVLRGKARLGQRKLKSASADLSLALSIAPDDLMAHTLVADALAMEGNSTDAQAKYRWVLEQNPDYEPAKRGLDQLTAPKSVRAAPAPAPKKKKN